MSFPRPLPGLVQESLAGLGLNERLREAEIWRIWPDVVGAALAGRARPLRIINGTLTVAVSSAPWMQEIRFMTAMMREKLNSCLGAEVVSEIVLTAGRVETPSAEVPEEPVAVTPLTSIQQAFIDEQSACIEDSDTRQAFIDLMRTTLERQR
jgi:hypothetical protein